MFKTNAVTKERPKIVPYIKGLMFAIIASLGLILIFAALIKVFDISDKAILPVNIFIKIISIFIGVLIALKENKQGIKKGIIVGFFYIILSFLLFSALAKSFALDIKFLYDIIFGVLVGAICGIIAVNIKRK